MTKEKILQKREIILNLRMVSEISEISEILLSNLSIKFILKPLVARQSAQKQKSIKENAIIQNIKCISVIKIFLKIKFQSIVDKLEFCHFKKIK